MDENRRLNNKYTPDIWYITYPDGRTIPTNVKEDIRQAQLDGLTVGRVDPRDQPKGA